MKLVQAAKIISLVGLGAYSIGNTTAQSLTDAFDVKRNTITLSSQEVEHNAKGTAKVYKKGQLELQSWLSFTTEGNPGQVASSRQRFGISYLQKIQNKLSVGMRFRTTFDQNSKGQREKIDCALVISDKMLMSDGETLHIKCFLQFLEGNVSTGKAPCVVPPSIILRIKKDWESNSLVIRAKFDTQDASWSARTEYFHSITKDLQAFIGADFSYEGSIHSGIEASMHTGIRFSLQ